MSTTDGAIRVLLADDEPHLGAILEQFLTARGFAVTTVRDGRAALDTLRREPFDVALLDVVMPELDGLEVLRRLREEATPPEILIITGNGTVETSLAALRLGAYDVLSKPYRMAEIEALIRRAWEKRLLVRENHRLRARLAPAAGGGFVTRYAPLQAVLSTLEPVRGARSPVIIWGEAGVGKRALAQWFHAAAPAEAPFVEWSPGDGPDDAIGASLFGAEATEQTPLRIGALETAGGGTLLLRALARLGDALQERIEQALTSGHFTRQGGTQPITLDARLVVALMRDPERLVQEGALRRSLVEALSATTVALPPLRERQVDVALLAQHIARQAGARELSAEAVAWLEAHAWPRNVRELAETVRTAARTAVGGVVPLAALLPAVGATANARPDATSPTPPPRTLEQVERDYIAETLVAVDWHQGRAAELLGISPKTLYRKIREYGFTRPRGRATERRTM